MCGVAGRIESVADLYNALGGERRQSDFLITYDLATQTWHTYFGEDRGAIADRALTDQTGILADIKTATTVRLAGDALGTDGASAITLTSGLNLVGLPLKDPRIIRVSDLFALEAVGSNIAVIIVMDNGVFKMVGRRTKLEISQWVTNLSS